MKKGTYREGEEGEDLPRERSEFSQFRDFPPPPPQVTKASGNNYISQ